jgi:hypothetical protein
MKITAAILFALMALCCSDDDDSVRLRPPTTVRICASGAGMFSSTFRLDGSMVFFSGQLPNGRDVEGNGKLTATYTVALGNTVCVWSADDSCDAVPPPRADCGQTASVRAHL